MYKNFFFKTTKRINVKKIIGQVIRIKATIGDHNFVLNFDFQIKLNTVIIPV